MEVLVTGGDTDLGRTIAEGFRDAGHQVVILVAPAATTSRSPPRNSTSTRSSATTPTRRASKRPAACSRTTWTPSSTCRRRSGTPATRAPTRWPTRAKAWRNALDATRALGGADRADRRRPPALRWFHRQRRAREPARGQRRRRDQGRRVELDRGAGEPSSAPAASRSTPSPSGRSAQAGYDGLCGTAAVGRRRDRPAGAVPHHAGRPAHHRSDAARQPRRARQLRLIFPRSPEAKRGDRPA